MSDTDGAEDNPRKELNQKLIVASGSGDHESVKRLLEDGADITTKTSNGNTGLHLSVARGHEDVAITFLNHGIDVNISDKKWTPLMQAAHAGQMKMARLLLNHGANVNLRADFSGATALIIAAKKNFPDLVNLFLENGADETLADNASLNAIQWAEKEGNYDVIKVFCEAWQKNGASLHLELLSAAKEGRGRLVLGMILAGADVETRNERGETGLDLAVKGGHREAAEMFLDHGIIGYTREECLEECNKNRERIVQLNMEMLSAAKSGENDSVIRLLEEGAEITSKKKYGDMGIHLSAYGGHNPVIKTFLDKGIDVDIKGGRFQWTALINAANYGHLTSLKLLLDAGADPDLIAQDGYTALSRASINNYPEIVSELLRRGADETIEDKTGRSAKQWAEKRDHQDVVKIFEIFSNKENINDEMLASARQGKWRLLLGLIIAGDVKTKNNDGNTTVLHVAAAKKGHISVVRALINHGIDVNSKGWNDRTPLMTASVHGHHRIVKLLIKSGAGIDLQNEYGWSALMLAVREGRIRIVLELLELGADRDIKDSHNKTALQVAQQMGHHVIASILNRGRIQADDDNAAEAVLAAAEAGCPKVLSDLLQRGASSTSARNAMGENASQVAAKYPQTIKEKYKQYLEVLKKKKEMTPNETLDWVFAEAEEISRQMAKHFLSTPLLKHDLKSIENKMQEVVNLSSQSHIDEKTFGDDQKFYLKFDADGSETLMESIVEQNLIKEREVCINVMKQVDAERYTDNKKAPARIKRQVKQAVPSSIGLRECLRSISEKFPWGRSKLKTMVIMSFIVQVLMGLSFYSLDVYTDINFALNMHKQSNRNFTTDFIQCHGKFNEEFDQTIETCKMSFDKKECMKSLDLIKKSADNCFKDEKRFENPNDWRIAGVVCAVHIGLPIFTAFVVWTILLVQENCSRDILSKLPLPFVTKIFRFWYDWEMFEILADPGKIFA